MYRSEPSDEYLESMTEAVMRTPTSAAVTLIASIMYVDEGDLHPVMDEVDVPALFVDRPEAFNRVLEAFLATLPEE